MIINLTQHPATPDQIAAGVVDLPQSGREALAELLTFEELPDLDDIQDRAEALVLLAFHNDLEGDDVDDPFPEQAMIGGAPWLMEPLAKRLRAHGIIPLFAFSRRESIEQVQQDGSVRKTNVLKHAGFVEARK